MDEGNGMLKKGLALLALPFALQLAFLAVLLRSQVENQKAQERAFHTKDVIAEVELLTRRLVAIRSNLLGQAASGRDEVNPIAPIAREIGPQLDHLHDLTSDNPGQQATIDGISEAAREYVRWITESEALLKLDRTAGLGRVRTQKGKEMLDAIQKGIERFEREENRLDLERITALGQSSAWQFRSIVAGTIVTMGLAAVLVVIYTRGFARRVAALVENARRLAEGKPPVAPVGGRDEIGLLAQTFDQMARSLSERERENEMFIYSVSHDLRSPLVNLQGFSRELDYTAKEIASVTSALEKPPAVQARLDRLLKEDMPDSIRFIQTAVTRLSGIIDSLLRLSRAGRVEYRIEALDMNALAARVVDAQRQSTEEKGAEIAVGDLPPARGDSTAVEQIVSNLLTNAVKYLDPARPGRVEVSGERSGGDGSALITYHVKDNGLGIPAAHQGKLFVAFQRLHPGVAEGQGVGLALVRRIVERQGGRIWAESEPGVGSTFSFTLPAAPTDPEPGMNS